MSEPTREEREEARKCDPVCGAAVNSPERIYWWESSVVVRNKIQVIEAAVIEAALRAVPTVCGNLKHPAECRETGCVETGYPDYPAMARAVQKLFQGFDAT